MSPLKRQYYGKDESPEVKKSRSDTNEEQVIEHSQIRYAVDETVLSILAGARGPMHFCEIMDKVIKKLQGIRIRHLGHLAYESWQHLVQNTLNHGLARNWFAVTMNSESTWLGKYEITSIGRNEIEKGRCSKSKELTRSDDKSNTRGRG